MQYTWIERDGYYCAASEWQPAYVKPEEYRLIFPIAPVAEANSWLLTTNLEFVNRELVYHAPGSRTLIPTGIVADDICKNIETRPVPKPEVSRRKTKAGDVQVTDYEWSYGAWKPCIHYETIT